MLMKLTVFHVTLEVLFVDALDFYLKWHPSPIALHYHYPPKILNIINIYICLTSYVYLHFTKLFIKNKFLHFY